MFLPTNNNNLGVETVAAEAVYPAPGATFGVEDFRERLARIEAQLSNCATREDIADIRTLIERRQAETMRWLVTVLSGTLVAIAIALIRTFL